MSTPNDTNEIPSLSAPQEGADSLSKNAQVPEQPNLPEDSFAIHGHQYGVTPIANSASLQLVLPSMPLGVADPMATNNQMNVLSVQQQEHTSDVSLLHVANGEHLGAKIGAQGVEDPSAIAGPNFSTGTQTSQVREEYIAHRAEGTHVQFETGAPLVVPQRQPQGRKPRKDFGYRLKEVKAFKQKHGHCMIPHKYKENPSLGTWTDTQRRRYRKTMEAKKLQGSIPVDPNTNTKRGSGLFISQEHVDQLEAVGFVFEPRFSRQETWERRVQEIQSFKAKHCHCNVREDDKSNPGLGKWVSYVRRTYRLSKQKKGGQGKNKLSVERIAQLKSIGFIFELKEELAMKRFRDGIKGLKEFLEREGHLQVPKFFTENPTLGLCVEDMRIEYRKILKSNAEGGNAFSDTMTAAIVKELSDMGFLAEEGQITQTTEATVDETYAI